MRLRAALPAPLRMAVTILAVTVSAMTVLGVPALAQKAPPRAAPQAAPASLPGQADVENAATAARAWMEHVVGGILDGAPTEGRSAPPPRRDR